MVSDFQITSRPPACLVASVLKTAFLKPGGHDPEDGGAPDGIAEALDVLVEELDAATATDDVEVDADAEIELEFDGVVWFREAPESEAVAILPAASIRSR